jgi:hypothetical protein
MRHPFHAIVAILAGALAYAALVFGYHAATGAPASWNLELFALGAFVVGAVVARTLWR